MTVLSFDDDGVDVVYRGIEFRLDRELLEEALDKPYPVVTDHDVHKLVDPEPDLHGEPRQVADILE